MADIGHHLQNGANNSDLWAQVITDISSRFSLWKPCLILRWCHLQYNLCYVTLFRHFDGLLALSHSYTHSHTRTHCLPHRMGHGKHLNLKMDMDGWILYDLSKVLGVYRMCCNHGNGSDCRVTALFSVRIDFSFLCHCNIIRLRNDRKGNLIFISSYALPTLCVRIPTSGPVSTTGTGVPCHCGSESLANRLSHQHMKAAGLAVMKLSCWRNYNLWLIWKSVKQNSDNSGVFFELLDALYHQVMLVNQSRLKLRLDGVKCAESLQV